jgi:hypothetical protein
MIKNTPPVNNSPTFEPDNVSQKIESSNDICEKSPLKKYSFNADEFKGCMVVISVRGEK